MSPQNRYWILTLSCAIHPHQPKAIAPCIWVKGQKEEGAGGYIHWQFVASFSKPVRRKRVVESFPGAHAEPTISQEGSEAYVFKEDTRIEGTQFEDGTRAVKRNCKHDWEDILLAAKSDSFERIPPDVVVRYYSGLKRIAADNILPVAMERTVKVFWGKTQTGKSHAAWAEAGLDAYIKNPNTKWWDGYRRQRNVIIDEFRGRIDISYMLLWTDKYPITVEIKGGSKPVCYENVWILSNLHPKDWYPDIDEETRNALLRRLRIYQFLSPFANLNQ